MKTKASITLSSELLEIVDRRALRKKTNRSDFIETAIKGYLLTSARAEQNARELEILNRTADAHRAEAEDMLSYQIPL